MPLPRCATKAILACAVLAGLCFSPVSRAEYRAFELIITNSVTGTERVVDSNLDPDQYIDLHPLQPNENITYRRTWMCKGDTSHKPICPKPPDPSQGPTP